MPLAQRSALVTPVLVAGCIVIVISFAIRSSFGIFQIPIAEDFGWLRADFSFAIAIQNLAWGIGQPLFSAFAERWGDRRAILLGGLTFALGLTLSAHAVSPGAHAVLQLLVGFGIAGTGFGVILAVVGRATAPEHRSLALGVATAAGSAGQVIGPPVTEVLLAFVGWPTVFLIFAGAVMASLLALPLMRVPPPPPQGEGQSMTDALRTALRDPTFTLIFIGFFSCGYQLAFFTAHFPAFVSEMCAAIDPSSLLADIGVTTTSALGAVALGVIGLANIAGTLGAAALGQRYSKKYLLAGIYAARTVVASAFILSPITPNSVLVFATLMGALWLATVPLTSGLIAQIYGLRYMGTLYGIVFFSHQLGGFLGVWMGGALYDITGNYLLVWWIGAAVGAFSALVHLPVRERPLAAA